MDTEANLLQISDLPLHRLPPPEWRDGENYLFLGFVIEFHTSQCSCGAKDSWSSPMRIFGHKSLVASNLLRYVPMLRQTSVMPQNEPMALIDRPMVETTICHHCIGRYNAVGAETIQLRADTDKRNWLHALMEEQRKQYRAAAAAQSAKGPPKIVASDKELMSL